MNKALLVALALVGLTTAPSLGAVSAYLTVDDPDQTLNLGQTTVVRLYVSALGEPATMGIMSVSVSVAADVGGLLTSALPVTVTWVAPLDAAGALPPLAGSPGPNGGIQGVAASVPIMPTVMDLGLAGPVEALNFEVTASLVNTGVVNLAIQNYTGDGYDGIVTWGSVVGSPTAYQGVEITVVPEPASLALLGLGGLAALRRRK